MSHRLHIISPSALSWDTLFPYDHVIKAENSAKLYFGKERS